MQGIFVKVDAKTVLPKKPILGGQKYVDTDLGPMWYNFKTNSWYFPGMSVPQSPQPIYWYREFNY